MRSVSAPTDFWSHFSPQRIGTVSVLAACVLFVSIFALTNREKINDNQSNFDGFLQL